MEAWRGVENGVEWAWSGTPPGSCYSPLLLLLSSVHNNGLADRAKHDMTWLGGLTELGPDLTPGS